MAYDKDKATGSSQLVQRMDLQEFSAQYQAIYRRLWLIATSIVGDRFVAEDIVQEAALIAYRKLDTFQTGTNFGAWVARIVKNCSANHNRKLSSRRLHVTDPSSLDELATNQESDTQLDWRLDLPANQAVFDDDAIRVLKKLSADARACLLLRVVDGMSYAEISDFLGIPEGTAMSHVHRGKQDLRRVFLKDSPSSKGGDE